MRLLQTMPLQLSVALILMLPASAGAAARAEGPAPQDWQRLPLTERVARLDTPASGAFFARTGDAYLRSDDGGINWASLPLPPPPLVRPFRDAVIVDPTEHSVLWAAGQGGLYRSLGEPVQWMLSLPLEVPVLRVSISPADPAIVYAAAAQGSGSFQLWRSDDRGDNWSMLLGPLNGAVCGWVIPVLDPNPIDPQRAFGSWRCHAGREVPGGGLLRHTADRGVTWIDQPGFRRPGYFHEEIQGGFSANPRRFYARVNRGADPGGGFLARSDDGGETWTDVFSNPSSPAIGALAVDPANPDRLFIGLSGEGRSVLASEDGGATWAALGREPIGPVLDLALGVDGANVFAATATGLWRFPFSPPPANTQ